MDRTGKNKIISYINKHKLLSLVLVLMLLALILYPRFNMQDISIIRSYTGVESGEMTPDQKNYYNFTEYFKGHKELNTVWAPFSYRPLMPFAASLLPFDSMLSMSIVNVIANLLTLLLIYLILKKLKFDFAYRIIGLLLFIVSFPLLYYGSSGFLEPTANLFIYLIVFLVVSNKLMLIPISFILASFVKEVTIIALPFALVYYYLNYRDDKSKLIKAIIFLAVSFCFFVVGSIFTRIYFATDNLYIWSPTFETAINNLSRSRTYLSFILSFGLVGFLSLLYAVRNRMNITKQELLPFYTGMLFSILLSFYSVIAAYSDGRFIWTGYPFMIIISVYFIRELTSDKTIRVT